MPSPARRRRLVRAAWAAGALVYVAATAWLVFGPAPGAEAEAVGTAVRRVESRLANQPRDVDADIALFGLRDEEFSNVLLFVPLPILLALRWPRWWWAGLPVGIATSATIELVQLIVLDHRSPTWRDLQWNSVGAAIGTAIAGVGVWCWRRWRRGRRR